MPRKRLGLFLWGYIWGIKRYVDNQIEWLKRLFDAEVKSIREAVGKVERDNKYYRESQNEWRGQLKDADDRKATKDSVENLRSEFDKRFKALEEASQRRQGTMWAMGITCSIIILGINVLLWYLSK